MARSSKGRSVAIAFAGAGKPTIENTTDLLNDFLGFGPEDKDGIPEVPEDLDLHLVFPVTESHLTEGLETVLEWTDYADLAYDALTDGTTSREIRKALKFAENNGGEEVKKVNEELISDLVQSDAEEKYLILLWGDDDQNDENAEVLLDLVQSHPEIKALDLTAGLDDIGFGDDAASAPEPEPEPEPEPDPEPRRRGRRRSVTDDEEKPLADEPKAEEPKEEPAPKRTRRTKAQIEADNAAAEAAKQEAVDEEANARFSDKEIEQTKAEAVDDPRFKYHAPDETSIKHHERIREATALLVSIFESLPGNSREKSLAVTKAEEAMFWANAHVARNITGQGSQEAPEEPKRGRGRPRNDGQPTSPRTAAEKAVVEIWDEDDEKWVRKGRGRVPKDAKTRLVDPKTGDVVEPD